MNMFSQVPEKVYQRLSSVSSAGEGQKLWRYCSSQVKLSIFRQRLVYKNQVFQGQELKQRTELQSFAI